MWYSSWVCFRAYGRWPCNFVFDTYHTTPISKVMFCRVCRFRVRVWESYRTSRVFGYSYRTHQSSGYCGTGVQISQKFRAGTKHAVPVPRVLWHGSHRTHRSYGYGYESLTEVPEAPGTGMKVLQNFQKFPVLWHGHTELAEVPGRYENVVPVPREYVALAYRSYISSVYGYGMSYRSYRSSGYGQNPGKYTAFGEEFNLKWRIPLSLHRMLSLGHCSRGNPW